tara:strand:- start:1840 stop:2145 length:306 start_codon:yes stop_codon:yes gene_type:complete
MSGTAITGPTSNYKSTKADIETKTPGNPTDQTNCWSQRGSDNNRSNPIAINSQWYGSGAASCASNVCTTVVNTGNTNYSFYCIIPWNGAYWTYNCTRICDA